MLSRYRRSDNMLLGISILAPSTQDPAAYQYTHFDAAGIPLSHSVFRKDSIAEIARELPYSDNNMEIVAEIRLYEKGAKKQCKQTQKPPTR